jgi:hypothetical protein
MENVMKSFCLARLIRACPLFTVGKVYNIYVMEGSTDWYAYNDNGDASVIDVLSFSYLPKTF